MVAEASLNRAAARAERCSRVPSSCPVSSRALASGSAGAHQRLADQHRVDADPLQLLQLGARRRCRSRRPPSCRRGRRASAHRWWRRRPCPSSRSRLLIPITSASSSSARSSSSLVVDLDQAVEVEPAGLLVQRRQQLASSRARDDQQHGVGAVDRRLVELVGVDDEVLAQDRQVAGGARRRAGRSSEPPKWRSSVSTESAAAPPRS